MAYTAEQFKEAARKAYAAGDVAAARKLITRAKTAEGIQGVSDHFQGVVSGQIEPPQPAQQFGPTFEDAPEYVKSKLKTEQYYRDNPESSVIGAAGGLAQGGTFGFGDEISAGIRSLSPNITYDQALGFERGRLAAARTNTPVATYGGEIAGAIATPMIAAKGATLGAKMGSGAAAGAAGGGIYGFGSGEGGERGKSAVISALLGGGLGAAIPVVGAGIQKIANSGATRKAIADLVAKAPSSEELKAAGRAAYGAVENAGVSVKPSAVGAAMDDIGSFLASEGAGLDVGGKVFPGARAVMDAAKSATQGKNTIPFNELDVFRRFMGNAASSNPTNKADTRLTTTAMQKLDDFVQNLTPSNVDAGDIDALKTMLPKAREIWTKMSKSQMIDDAISAGDNYMSGAASGIRNQFARILRNPKLSRGFSDAEKSVIRRVVNGSIPERLIHLAGGGLGKLTTMAGGAFGGGVGGAIGGAAAATGLEKASEAIVRRNAEIARALVASGGLNGTASASPAARKVIEALLLGASRPTAASFAPPIAAGIGQ